MTNKNSFWILDFDPEGEIYESLSWDLPGFRVRESSQPQRAPKHAKRRPRRNRQ
jgi:hypothetical protein